MLFSDHFKHHFDHALTPEEVSSLQFSSPGPPSLCPPLGLVCSRAGLPGTELPLPPLPCLSLSQCHVSQPNICPLTSPPTRSSQNSARIRPILVRRLYRSILYSFQFPSPGSLSDLQRHLLPIICSYKVRNLVGEAGFESSTLSPGHALLPEI